MNNLPDRDSVAWRPWLSDRMCPCDERASSRSGAAGAAEVRGYVGQDTRSTADEIAKFADLRDRGAISDEEVISDEEFQQARRRRWGGSSRRPAATGPRSGLR